MHFVVIKCYFENIYNVYHFISEVADRGLRLMNRINREIKNSNLIGTTIFSFAYNLPKPFSYDESPSLVNE